MSNQFNSDSWSGGSDLNSGDVNCSGDLSNDMDNSNNVSDNDCVDNSSDNGNVRSDRLDNVFNNLDGSLGW